MTVTEFRTRSIMPGEDIDDLESRYPGFLASKLEEHSSRIDSRLVKRYAVPLRSKSTDAPPEIVYAWLTAFVTLDAYLRRGFNPSSEQDAYIAAQRDWADEDIKEVSDAETGRYELLLVTDGAAASAVTKGGPLAYSEPSPYEWQQRQVEAVGRRGGRYGLRR
ncbi:hypothetical protein WME76_02260 [Sorangium sp. So ce119]|uniref:hypothetical protein n=1 Tax=Sorangium sp. So ce119 TaxID=3133279 RepID=UPI003F60FF84